VTQKTWHISHDGVFISPLPNTILNMERLVHKVIERHSVPPDFWDHLIKGVTDAVMNALFWNGITFGSNGAGRRVDVPGQLLSSEVDQLFRSCGITGNSLRSRHDEIGVIAETEAVARTVLRQILGDEIGVMARPARISAARRFHLRRN
jgi:hypothetical protein